MQKLGLAIVLILAFSISINAASFKESLSFGTGDRCAFMCSAFRDNVIGLCMSKGYSKGSASNCKCKEGVANPTAYGDISCLGSLGDDYGNIMKLFLSGRQCREMASVYSYEISAKCRTKGYKII